MRALLVLLVLAVSPRASEACVQFDEANKLLGWAADGSLALHVRLVNGKVEHAELLPTRYEGWRYLVAPSDGATGFELRKMAIGTCDTWSDGELVERGKGALTEAKLLEMAFVKKLGVVTPPSDDGGASELIASFVPRKRYAEHQIAVRDEAKAVVATLPVPVWCMGSCLRDEDWRRWGATVTAKAKAGGRTLYVIRMKRVCNGGNDKDMWIDRVIAEPATEKRPKKGRCRGSG